MAEQTNNSPQAAAGKRSYSVAEAAEILGVSRRSVYNLCAEGAFKAVHIGSRLRISKKSFDEWLDGGSDS
ncbi:MAG: helix-turn-helix domain-containing protein [Lachnospiraceae bacterium]|nr:helix-turn-helix domain-containing protein [Lachnospiraceae bacterium]MCM1239369.1 helix-turn-helix domain-containing protein [Lachnospiraceae bacterium]